MNGFQISRAFSPYETEGAPRLRRIACRRGVKGVDIKLMPVKDFHDTQIEKTFGHENKDKVNQMIDAQDTSNPKVITWPQTRAQIRPIKSKPDIPKW